eukprot:19728-Heterococcus_DN1.PRE.2
MSSPSWRRSCTQSSLPVVHVKVLPGTPAGKCLAMLSSGLCVALRLQCLCRGQSPKSSGSSVVEPVNLV